jgi:hypothetical protein
VLMGVVTAEPGIELGFVRGSTDDIGEEVRV